MESRTHQERWDSAANTFRRFVPEAEPGRVAASFARRLGPLGAFAFETVGAMWDRPALSRRDRSLLVVSTLAAQARDEELVGHTQIGLRHGLTRVELEEILPMVAAYAGFPAAMSASRAMDEGLRLGEGVDKLGPRTGIDAKDDERRDADAAAVVTAWGHDPDAVRAVLVERLGDLGELIYRWGLGEVWARPALSPRDRSVVAISILTSLGGADAALADHVGIGLASGLTPDEIVEVVTHLGLYAGLVRASAAMTVVRAALVDA